MKIIYNSLLIFILVVSCITPKIIQKEANKKLPTNYSISVKDSTNIAKIKWRDFFEDKYLIQLIDSALVNNQEMNIFLQDIEISKNEVKEKKGEYLPKVGIGDGIGDTRVSENTKDGAIDRVFEKNNERNPDLEIGFGGNLSWEIDVWKKLRNTKNAAEMRLLANKEGKNLLTTRLISEISNSYYELMALDNSIKILDDNIKIQEEAYTKMKYLKDYAKSNQLAVNRFAAQLLNTKNQKFNINQQIIETENRLKFLTGKIANKIERSSNKMMEMEVKPLQTGVPTQLLENRPDIRQAEYSIQATKLDLKAAKANLYPSLGIVAGLGFKSFDPTLLLNPGSLVYNTGGDLMAPLINRNAIIAKMKTANSNQIQAALNYEQKLLMAYTEVLNQISKIDNSKKGYETKKNEVQILKASIDIANSLFLYAKADYIEVLLTQEEYLKESIELVDSKLQLISSKVNLYRTLGGGWN